MIEKIIIKGAREHNLKNIDVEIPRDKLVVMTGLSGSGKSSLAFDTIYADGQRRYMESLSSYARQFLGQMEKPDVDSIDGIPPAIAIEQKVTTRNPRSTVGTVTEIYDYMKLLFARAGHTISPISGQEVKRHTVQDVVECLRQQAVGAKVLLLSPIITDNQTLADKLKVWQQQGFSRLYRLNEDGSGDTLRINSIMLQSADHTYLLVDRVVADGEQATLNRFADSVQTAFFEGKGECRLIVTPPSAPTEVHIFSERFEADGITFVEPSEHLFDFNNPLGACPTCGGFGNVIGIDPDLVVPDKSLSVYDGAIACWRGEKMSLWNDALVYNADKFDFPIHTPFYALTHEQKQLIWTGNEYFHGLNDFFRELESKQYDEDEKGYLIQAYKNAGYIYWSSKNNLETAKPYFEKLIKLDPNNSLAKKALGLEESAAQ